MKEQAKKQGSNRIVIAVEFDETGDNALKAGIGLAHSLSDSRLHLVHVIATDTALHDARKVAELERKTRACYEELKQRALRAGTSGASEQGFQQHSTLHVRLGDPAKEIHQVAVDADADWIVVGTHGAKGIEKLILGSVAETLIRTARLPVLVARPKDFHGLDRTETVEPPRPGEDLHKAGLSTTEILHFHPRNTHLSGLI